MVALWQRGSPHLQKLKISSAYRWTFVVCALVLLALASQSLRLGQELRLRLSDLSAASTDNLQWTLSQAEVDYLKYYSVAIQAETQADLAGLRRQFDVYYSRISTFRESGLYSALRQGEAQETLDRLNDGLQRQVLLIDAADEELLAQLPQLVTMIEQDGEDARTIALKGVALQANLASSNRSQMHELFEQLAVALLFLFCALLLVLFFTLRLFIQGRRLEEQNLKDAARTQTMVSAALDAILMADEKGRIWEFNAAAEQIFGYSRDEALGMDLDALIRVDGPDVGESHEHWLDRIDLTESDDDGRIRMTGMHKSGSHFPAELSLSVSSSGEDAYLVSYIRDVSARLATEQDLRHARDEALEGVRTKDRLLTVMSHEMRTPLNGILGSLDVLEQTGATREQEQYLGAMRVSAELLLHHVNDVLQLSRLEADTEREAQTTFDLSELLDGIIASQQAQATKNRNELSGFCNIGAMVGVRGKQRGLQQVLLNLIGNALKFTEDGAVSVDIMRLEGDLVEISVADTGKGIAEEDLDRIFDDFIMLDQTYARTSEGTGLGLAITRRLVEDMGGEITCESEPGEGSIFTLTVPLPPVELIKTRKKAVGVTDKNGRNILVIEDNDINRLLLEKMLKDLGHVVTCACDGQQGLDLISDNAYDLIISDISMPGKDGIAVVQETRARHLADDVELVALTAHAAAEDHVRIREAGFAEVVTKPVNRATLADVIGRLAFSAEAEAISPERPEKTVQNGGGATSGLSDMQQFVSAIGDQKARVFLRGFQAEMDLLRHALSEAKELDEALRQEAHRLAGSAAVLGLAELRAELLAVEHSDGAAVPAPEGLDQAWEQAKERMGFLLEPQSA